MTVEKPDKWNDMDSDYELGYVHPSVTEIFTRIDVDGSVHDRVWVEDTPSLDEAPAEFVSKDKKPSKWLQKVIKRRGL